MNFGTNGLLEDSTQVKALEDSFSATTTTAGIS